MKQLLSLLLIISISILSWSCFAKSTVIQVNSLYIKSPVTSSSMTLKPSLSNQLVNEIFVFKSKKVMDRHNDFFETTMIFNEKLQQFIAFFEDSHDEIEEVASNNLTSSKNNKSTTEKCKASS